MTADHTPCAEREGAELLRVSLCGGKYTVIQPATGGLRALRYGEEWRDLTGDGLVLALAYEVQELRDAALQAAVTLASEDVLGLIAWLQGAAKANRAAYHGADADKLEWASGLIVRLVGENATLREAEEARAVSAELRKVRPEVAAFALLMERELRANDHKPGWKGDDARDLADRVREEANELYDVSRMDWSATRPSRIASEAADVANMAMMVADACGCLDIASDRTGGA